MNYLFPLDIPSAVTDFECQTLHNLAENKIVLELGSFYGRSTIAMAQSANRVYSVDTHKGDNNTGPADTYPAFKDNLVKYNVVDRVFIYVGEFHAIGADLPIGVFDMCFLDGQHDYDSVVRDIALMQRIVKGDGILAFHDYTGPSDVDTHFGVNRAVNELAAREGKAVSRLGNVAWL